MFQGTPSSPILGSPDRVIALSAFFRSGRKMIVKDGYSYCLCQIEVINSTGSAGHYSS